MPAGWRGWFVAGLLHLKLRVRIVRAQVPPSREETKRQIYLRRCGRGSLVVKVLDRGGQGQKELPPAFHVLSDCLGNPVPSSSHRTHCHQCFVEPPVLRLLHHSPLVRQHPDLNIFIVHGFLFRPNYWAKADEALFWLNGYVNKQNCRIWSEANPQVYVETPLHPEKVTVWCALWAGGIIGPYFFKNDEGHNVTVNGDRYRAMITNFFIPE
ncbi:hypothetical protein TNCV_3151661 [Trichonephila clavipes]|nr:hypothetical protein TNCV_3151661 [Trichonephila clavipes]